MKSPYVEISLDHSPIRAIVMIDLGRDGNDECWLEECIFFTSDGGFFINKNIVRTTTRDHDWKKL